MIFRRVGDVRAYMDGTKFVEEMAAARKQLAEQLGPQAFNAMLDHSALDPLNYDAIDTVVDEAAELGCQICTDGQRLADTIELLEQYGAQKIRGNHRVSVVADFPHGCGNMAQRADEVAFHFKKGADEVDIVAPNILLTSSQLDESKAFYAGDLQVMVERSQYNARKGGLLKVIINAWQLGDEEIEFASGVVAQAGRDYHFPVMVKTSTGFPLGKYSKDDVAARLDQVWLMRQAAGAYHATNNPVGVKPAGGQKTAIQCLDSMIVGGLTGDNGQLVVRKEQALYVVRIGTSAARAIAEDFVAKYAA